jgi:GNAT superfamily N-acetyltransferase
LTLEIVDWHEEHLAEAAGLVAQRCRDLRQHVSLIPGRYERTEVIVPLLEGLVHRPGAVAILDGRLTGFLTGFILEEFMGRRSAYSPEWANGACGDESGRIHLEMYRHLSARWLAEGCAQHVVTMLAHDQAGAAAWQWLGFGLIVVDAVRGLEPVDGEAAAVEIRRAGPADLAEVNALGRALEAHMLAAPAFWVEPASDAAERLGDPSHAFWLAYQDGQVVAGIGLEPELWDGCDVVRDEGTIVIVSAHTCEHARGRGVATALLNRSLEWAQAENYERCAVDFQTANLEATRFWMRYFEPVCYSMSRCIDERVGA